MKKGNLIFLSIFCITALMIWFSCNPLQTANTSTATTFNVLDNSDTIKATGALAIYVSPSGSDTNDGLTSSTPLYSLGIATQWAVAGTTIYVAAGTYNYNATVTLSAVGTASQPIQILATGGKAILNYSSWVPANETERGAARGIKVETTAQYWYLKGLEICYAPDNGCKCEGGHTTFEQCLFDHNGDGGLQIGLNKDTLSSNPDPEHYAAYTTVLNCDSTRNADVATGYENADGFSAKLYCGKGNYFYGCRSWENCDDGWDCYQSDYGPVIENCWSWHNGDPSIWGLSSFNGDGNGFKLGGDSTYMPCTVKNCIALNCLWGALGGFAYNDNTAPITLYNDVAITCGRPYNMQQDGNIITNCVEYGGTRPAPKDISSSSTCTNCTWTLGITASAADFVSVSEADAAAARGSDGSLPTKFGRLVSTSQLIDKGVNVGIAYLGAAPDLGAYECK
jgi:pectate disaccharide-lyase